MTPLPYFSLSFPQRAISALAQPVRCLAAVLALSLALLPIAQGAPTPQVTTPAILAWGNNQYGRLGDGTNTNRWAPVDITNNGALNGKTVIQISTGFSTIALCSDGTVATWGLNFTGQLGDGTTTDRSVPVDITHSGVLNGKTVIQVGLVAENGVALCSDGTLAVWGNRYASSVPIDFTGSGALKGKTVTRIETGYSSNFALCSDGTVAAWGANNSGQLGDGTTTGRPDPVDITNSGALKGKKVIQLALGSLHTLALCSDGTVAAWGNNDKGALGNGKSGTINNSKVPVNITNSGVLNGKTVIQLAAGEYRSLALCSDGTLASWGWNYWGAVGDGTTVNSSLPVDISHKGALNGKTVTQISSNGAEHTLALCSDGTVASWGNNDRGELGDGTEVDRSLPIDITNSGALNGKVAFQLTAGPALGESFALAAVVQAPTVVTGAATEVGPGNATVHATLNPNGAATTAKLEYGSTTAYGKEQNLPLAPANGIVNQNLSALLASLTPNTTYHYRVSATNSHGTTVGEDLTFTTPADTAKPTVIETTPFAGQKLLISAFKAGTLAGTASDNVGVVGVEVKLTRLRNGVVKSWNGSAFTTTSTRLPATFSGSGTNMNWSLNNQFPPTSQLDAGEYIAVVYATDASGNVGNTTTRFTLVTSDTEAPIAQIFTPTLNQKISISAFTSGAANIISGNATDNVGVANVRVRLSRKRGTQNYYWNGTAFTTSAIWLNATLVPVGGSSPKWNLDSQMPPASQLDLGLYQIEAYAVDVAGNKSATLVRPFTLKADSSASAIETSTSDS